MQGADLEVIKDIPGYKVILKAVLKSQIQQMVEQLADHTGEESVILTASVSDGSLSHLGSESGKVFLEDHDDIKSQFLGFCLKRYHRQKQIEKEKQQQILPDPGERLKNVPPALSRFSTGPRPRFSPGSSRPSPNHQISSRPGYNSPRQSGIHPVSLTRTSPKASPNVRHEPYSRNPPRRTSSNFDQQGSSSMAVSGQQTSSRKLSTDSGSVHKIKINPNEVIKIEAIDDDIETQSDKSVATSINDVNVSEADNTNVASSCQAPSSGLSKHSPVPEDSMSNSSASTIPNEPTELKFSDTMPPDGLGLDSDLSKLTGLKADTETDAGETSDITNVNETETSEIDPNISVKVEALAESEMDLEITGVELGNMAQSDNWIPNVQNTSDYGPSTSSDYEQGNTMGSQTSPGYVSAMRDLVTSVQGPSTKPGAMPNPTITEPQFIEEELLKLYKFKCEHCGKFFTCNWELKRHSTVHTGLKAHICTICGKGFTRKENLTIHMARFHS